MSITDCHDKTLGRLIGAHKVVLNRFPSTEIPQAVEVTKKRVRVTGYQSMVKDCIVGAVGASIAIAMDGEWRSAAWEAFIRHGNPDPNGFTGTGKFRNGSIPGPATLDAIRTALPGCTAEFWIYSPIWPLLRHDPCELKPINEALQALSGKKRELIWVAHTNPDSPADRATGDALFREMTGLFDAGEVDRALQIWDELSNVLEQERQLCDLDDFGAPGTGALRFEPSKEAFDHFASEPDLESFMGLLALTKEARARLQLRPMIWGAQGIRKILPALLGSTLELYVRWPTLVHLLNKQVFQPPKLQANFPWLDFRTNEIASEIQDCLSIPAKLLPPQRYIRRYSTLRG